MINASLNSNNLQQTQPLSAALIKPYLKKIIESPEEFCQFIGGTIGLGEGLYSSLIANRFSLFSTVKLTNDSLGLRILNTVISIGTRANWYYNFGVGISVLKKILVSANEEQGLSNIEKSKNI